MPWQVDASWRHQYQAQREKVLVLERSLGPGGLAGPAPVEQQQQRRQLVELQAQCEKLERQHGVTAPWTPQTNAYQQAQGERKLLAIRKLQQSIEGVLLQLQRAAATDARMDTDPRSRKELHAFTRLRQRLQRQLAMHVHQLQQWCSAPGPQPQPSFSMAAMDATQMCQPGYTLPWGTQISAAATTQARLTEARQREQRASEEQSILLREGADMVRYYEHRAEECRTSMAAAAADAPVDIPFSEPGMAAAAVSYWRQRYQVGREALLAWQLLRVQDSLKRAQQLQASLASGEAANTGGNGSVTTIGRLDVFDEDDGQGSGAEEELVEAVMDEEESLEGAYAALVL